MNKKLQVFVSSTYTDLIEERQAAVEAILDAGHIPAGMELFKAGNESQLKTIYEWIDECDIYMLILGGRYGTIESKSNKSYTQLEYEYALSKSIPIFAIILSDIFLTNKINMLGLENTIEQKEPDKYKTFKTLVMSKVIKKVNDCKDIKIAIHSSINTLSKQYNLTGWTRNNMFNFIESQNINSNIIGTYILFYYSYSKYNKAIVQSSLTIYNTGQVILKNNIKKEKTSKAEYIYTGICNNQNDIIYLFLKNKYSSEIIMLQLEKSVGNFDRYIGLIFALTSSKSPVCIKIACFKGINNINKINFDILKTCLTSNNTVHSKSSYIIEDNIKNLFFSDSIFYEL